MSAGTSAVHTPTSSGVDEKHLSSVTFEGDSEHEVGIDLYRRAAKVEWIPEENHKVLRKIDLWILPAFCITQGLAYLDKTALNYGNLFGMRTGLNVTTAQFSWFASVFYIGYLVATWPVSILLQKYSTGKVMGVVVFRSRIPGLLSLDAIEVPFQLLPSGATEDDCAAKRTATLVEKLLNAGARGMATQKRRRHPSPDRPFRPLVL